MTGGSLAIASPAQANFTQCTKYLAEWYEIGPKVKTACDTAADHSSGPLKGYFHGQCKSSLIMIGVTNTRADNACTKAQL
jgi:hypothetical protein